MSDLEGRWNSLDRVSRLILLNDSGIDFIEAGMESYPTTGDYHTNSAYQTILSQKLNEFAQKSFNSLPEPIKRKVEESFKDQDITTEMEGDNDYEMEGEMDDYKTSDGEDFSYKNTDSDIDDSFKDQSTEAYRYSLYTQVNPDGLSEKNLKKAKELIKDETDRYYEAYFNIINEVEYPHEEEIPVTRPDNAEPTGQYNDNPNAGLYDTKLFKQGKANDRIGEKFPDENEIDKEKAEEDSDEHNIYDQLKTDAIEEEKFSDAPESEDGALAKVEEFEVPEENTNEYDAQKQAETPDKEVGQTSEVETYDGKSEDTYEAEESGHYGCDDCEKEFDNYKDADEHEKEFGHSTTGAEIGKAGEAYVPHHEGNEVEQKIIERKMAGYNNQVIARELHIWHDMSPEEALEKVESVEVSTDDKVAFSLFGKPFSQISASEQQEMRTLAGEVRAHQKEDEIQ